MGHPGVVGVAIRHQSSSARRVHAIHVRRSRARAIARAILGLPGIPASILFGAFIMHVAFLPAMDVAEIAGAGKVTMRVTSVAGIVVGICLPERS